MESCLIQWDLCHHYGYLSLKLFPIWLIRALQADCQCPSSCPRYSSSTSLFSGTAEYSRLILYLLDSSTGIGHFSKDSSFVVVFFLIKEWVFINQDLNAKYFHALEVLLLPGLLCRQSWGIYVHINTCIYFCIYIYWKPCSHTGASKSSLKP